MTDTSCPPQSCSTAASSSVCTDLRVLYAQTRDQQQRVRALLAQIAIWEAQVLIPWQPN